MVFASLLLKDIVRSGEFSTENLLEIVDKAAKYNIKRLVIAPVYYDEESRSSKSEVKEIVKSLNLYLQEKGVDLILYYANLLRDNYENVNKFVEGDLSSINNSTYVLLDVEESNKIDDLLEVVFEYRLRNITPIIVSPERIEDIIKDNKRIEKLINEECLLQLDPASLEGVYGKKVQKTAKSFMKKDIYEFVGFSENIEEKYINEKMQSLSKKSLFILKKDGVPLRRIGKEFKKKKTGLFK